MAHFHLTYRDGTTTFDVQIAFDNPEAARGAIDDCLADFKKRITPPTAKPAIPRKAKAALPLPPSEV